MKLLLTVLFLPSIIAVEWPEAVGVAQSSATCTVDAADQAGSHDVLISKDDCIGLVAATGTYVELVFRVVHQFCKSTASYSNPVFVLLALHRIQQIH